MQVEQPAGKRRQQGRDKKRLKEAAVNICRYAWGVYC